MRVHIPVVDSNAAKRNIGALRKQTEGLLAGIQVVDSGSAEVQRGYRRGKS
jgi:hypothetical protein